MKAKCLINEPERDVIALDVVEGTGYCVCLLPSIESPEHVQSCWFKDGRFQSGDKFTVIEAAKFAAALTHAVGDFAWQVMTEERGGAP